MAAHRCPALSALTQTRELAGIPSPNLTRTMCMLYLYVTQKKRHCIGNRMLSITPVTVQNTPVSSAPEQRCDQMKAFCLNRILAACFALEFLAAPRSSPCSFLAAFCPVPTPGETK